MSTAFAFPVVLGLLLALAPLTLAQAQTVTVNCGKRKTIQQVLDDYQASTAPLVVEIRGMCREAVVVRRGAVTLHGTDPLADGIQAPSGAANALALRYARDVRVQNLTIAGASQNGLHVAYSSPVNVQNCRISDNLAVGLVVTSGGLGVTDTTITRNGTGGAVIADGSVGFTRCTFTDNHQDPAGDSAIIVSRGQVSLVDSSVTGWSALNILRSRFIGLNSHVTSDGSGTPVVNAYFGSTLWYTGGTISGLVSAGQTDLVLLSVEQTADAAGWSGINLYGTGTVAVGVPWTQDKSTIHGDIRLRNFAQATIEPGNIVNGQLMCFSGADAWCGDPSNVTGQSSCGQCQKP